MTTCFKCKQEFGTGMTIAWCEQCGVAAYGVGGCNNSMHKADRRKQIKGAFRPRKPAFYRREAGFCTISTYTYGISMGMSAKRSRLA